MLYNDFKQTRRASSEGVPWEASLEGKIPDHLKLITQTFCHNSYYPIILNPETEVFFTG